ncbi:MAG: NAD-dependent deacetylase [Deltaproteobacteria bacterium]|nr:NAD-dependent deacetylase [Deltaproteobacteria bacterium]
METKNTKAAAEFIKSSDAVILTAGAGMGVDSGLPDFRGDQGFWKAYPMYRKLGINFMDAANPRHFSGDPAFGWGFYGHRLNLYRQTEPHAGFGVVLGWIKRYGLDYYVVTSNVDGQFQKSGFPDEKVYEIHGSIHHLQCAKPCRTQIWRNDLEVEVNFEEMRALCVPQCRYCREVARPNVLMFGDYFWVSVRSEAQQDRFDAFLRTHLGKRITIIEIGAGTGLPSIRHLSESLGYQNQNALIIRINPREAQIDRPHLSLCFSGLEGIRMLDHYL